MLILGIDTGGTYTDGVIIDPKNKKVLSKAKVLTTKKGLMIGIGNCIKCLNIEETGKIKLMCLSTTLATNAIVEGRGGRVGLLLIGRELEGRCPADFIQLLAGKLDIKGKVVEKIDETEAIKAIENLKKHHIDAVAISGYASVRNPAQELQIKQIVHKAWDIPVVCAHELTSALGFNDRTVTAALSAKLTPIISKLIKATGQVLQNYHIQARIMIVKGDGSLMHESVAISKPIETILSGPAASVIGGMFLTNEKDAVLIDIGGTTTDIANIEAGKVKINSNGANVGGWQTQIKAVDVSTFGFGGDSYLSFGECGKLIISPQKVMPLCAAGTKYPHLIGELTKIGLPGHKLLSADETDCFLYINRPKYIRLSEQDKQIIRILEKIPHSILYIEGAIGKEVKSADLSRLVNMGVLERIALTPTDILHVMGKYNFFDTAIAKKCVEILANKAGEMAGKWVEGVYDEIIDKLMECCTKGKSHFEKQQMQESNTFCKPIVAIGAPVQTWMPHIFKKLNMKGIIPKHAEVANAVGAAVGHVMESAEALIRPNEKHKGFIVHAPWETAFFDTLELAKDKTLSDIKKYVSDGARRAGSERFEIIISHEDIYTHDKQTDTKTYIETIVKATAIGSPDWTV